MAEARREREKESERDDGGSLFHEFSFSLLLPSIPKTSVKKRELMHCVVQGRRELLLLLLRAPNGRR